MRLFTLSLIPTAEASQREFSVYLESSAAWPSAMVNRFS